MPFKDGRTPVREFARNLLSFGRSKQTDEPCPEAPLRRPHCLSSQGSAAGHLPSVFAFTRPHHGAESRSVWMTDALCRGPAASQPHKDSA